MTITSIATLARAVLPALAGVWLASTAGVSLGADPTTITAWARGSDRGFMQPIIEGFNKSQDEFKVNLTLVPDEVFIQKFGSASATGSVPDVSSLDVARIQYFSSVGALTDLTAKLENLQKTEQFSPAQLALANWNGADYAVPFSAEASVMFYNKSLFKKAGIDAPPANFKEIRAAADKITALGPDIYGFNFAGAGGGSNNFGLTPMIWASGGTLLSDDGKTASYDSPEVAAQLELLRGMVKAGDVPSSAATDTGANYAPSFLSGKIGMVDNGAFFVQELISAKPDFEWGITLIPGENGGVSSFTGGDSLVIPKGSKHPDAAWAFILYATGEQGQTTLAKLGAVPTRVDLAPKIYDPLDPRYPTLSKAVQVGKSPKTTLSAALFGDNQGPLATMINKAVFGGTPIPEAQQEAQKTAQQIIDNQD
jgi:multiple sugar transport system substrate-binding protein